MSKTCEYCKGDIKYLDDYGFVNNSEDPIILYYHTKCMKLRHDEDKRDTLELAKKALFEGRLK